MQKTAIVFSKPRDFGDPFKVLGAKRPVYEELITKLKNEDINMVITSIKGYREDGVFAWYWQVGKEGISRHDEEIKVALAFDRSWGLRFPVENDTLRVVDNLEFKKFAFNKWQQY